MNTKQSDDTWIVYDGDCPYCSNYVRLVRLNESIGVVRLVNARNGGPEIEQIIQSNLDLDDGMVLHYRGELYHGAQCMHMLALLSTRSGAFNRLSAALFSSVRVSRLAYPILRAGRNLLLKLSGRPLINAGSSKQ